MRNIPGYKLLNCLHEGISSNIYRAIRISDDLPVIVKVNSEKILTEKKAQRFQREFEIGGKINSPYVIRYLELKQDANYGIALVMEEINAVELTTIIPSQGFSDSEFLEIAIQIVQGLQAIHSSNIIHNDLKPSNILIQPTTKAIKIIDFNAATTLRQKVPSSVPQLLGTLAYISPEQTGRINRSVDYRTDFYSLGVMLYQLLCGQLPFIAKDALGLIHQHLAKQPQFPHRCKPAIALAISRVVMKLLEKEAENRYQSCEGILHDLNYCLSNLNETGTIPEFKLGLQDFSNKLILSQHLYGRENERKVILKAFGRVSEGKREVLMIAGQPGIGKSMLIQELQKPITLKQGYFLTGKFDQLNKNVAYGAVSQAFDGLIKQLLIEDEANIAQWKKCLLDRLGVHAQFVIKVVPTLTLLIGEQPAVTIADINQAKTVFNLAFHAFVEVFAIATHPLVIFLDDLQWADQASLDLMTYLMQQPKLSHLLWIGAYRDTEVTNFHPAMQAVAALQEAEVSVQTLTLSSLQLESLQQWIADSLRMPFIEVSSLVALIQQKTAGNPFFVKTFLQSLYDQQLLTFSQQTHWQWDIDKIYLHPATENVVALMTFQIQQLPPVTQEALSVASCLGHCISLNILQIAMASSKEIVCNAIQPALNSGILIQTEDEVYFVHDRVQEAAYYLLNETEKIHEHFTVGKRLEAHLTTEEAWLFDVVAQFNHCCSIVIDPQERLQMVRLNLEASQKAKQATAYAAALDYLHVSQIWIDINKHWQIDYALAFTLHKELAELEYLCGHVDISQDLITKMQPHLQSTMDKIEIYHLLIIQKIVQGQQREAITLGHQALQLLGSGLPLDNPTAFIQREMPLLKQKLADISLSSLLNAPLVENIEKQGMFKILAALISACYQLDPELLLVITLITINQSLIYGNAPEACLSYATYGLLICSMFQEYALGYEFGNFALQLAEKLQSPVQGSRSAMITHAFIYPWSKPVQHLPALLTSNSEACMAYGEIEYAGYSWALKIHMLFDQGAQLSKVQQELTAAIQFVQSTKTKGVIKNTTQTIQRIIINLMGLTTNEIDFNYNNVNEDNFIEDCQKSVASGMALGLHYIRKAQVFYLYGYFEQALQQLALAKEKLVHIPSFYEIAIYNWYDSLTRLALYPTLPHEKQQAYLQQVAQNQQQMQKWQANCPENFAHKYLLVAAELAQIKKDYAQAEVLYNQAIELAGRHGFMQEQALAAELTAKYWLMRNYPLCAQGYLNTAFSSYKQWGAKRKLMQLKARYADLLQAFAPIGLSYLIVNQETTLSSSSLKFLDLSSILKASQTISSEIELSKLLRNIMQIIIENAGAQQGALLFVELDEAIYVQAEYASDSSITTLQKIPLTEWAAGAHSVIQYVKRLQQSVVVDDAAIHEQFKCDPYISRTQAKSILCIPILKQTELKAILYLENKLMSYAFTPERVQTIQILTAQMAISLENARYFAEQLELTRQLSEQATRIKIAEESLHAVTHDLQLALQASKAGTWNLWIETRMLTWDEGCHALFGLKLGEFDGTYDAFMARVYVEDREQVNKYLESSIKENASIDIEYRIVWPDGSQHVISVLGHVYQDMQGRPTKMAGVCFDVTQRKQLEQDRLQAFQQAEKLERQRAIEAINHKTKLEEITDTMCHELRNPLNGLYGSSVLLHQHCEELKILRAQPYLQANSEAVAAINSFLIKAAEQLAAADICISQLKEIIDDVLDYSQLEHNKVALIEMPFDLRAMLSSVLQMFAQLIRQKNLEIILEFPVQPIILKSDESQLKRIVINLVINAIKFTSKGSIKIKAQEKLLSSSEIELWITVEDTGIGIPIEEQAHLFERFSSASRHTGAKYGGSGLGLAICKQLIEKMGGKIWVESQLGKGSKFNFTIRCKTLTAEEIAEWQLKIKQEKSAENLILESEEIDESGAKKNILVVEDNIVNQKILTSYLDKAGYTSEVANNGLEAIQKFTEYKFDAILMDIEMPEMDGIEATRKIRELEQTLNYATPIVALSGYVDKSHRNQALEAGMNDYLTKPYHKEAVYEVLKKHRKSELMLSTGVKKRKITKHRSECTKYNIESANYIVNNAIHTTLGRWHTYGCAFVPEDEQRNAIHVILEVFADRQIQPEEQPQIERVISSAIHQESPWYVCFNKIYSIALDENEFTQQLKTIHDQKKLVESELYSDKFKA